MNATASLPVVGIDLAKPAFEALCEIPIAIRLPKTAKVGALCRAHFA